MTTESALFYLLGAEVCKETKEENTIVESSAEMVTAVYALAKRHDLAHIVGHALSELGLLQNDEISQQFKQQAKQAVYRCTRMDHEYEKICQLLEQHRIPFIPLKGAVLRAYYPEPWMRTSCDIDILVKEEMLDTAVAALKENLGYTNWSKGDHDISLFSSSGVHLELHYDTIQERYAVNDCRDVLSQIWDDATPKKSGSYQYRMSDAMFYFYHIAHMAKHFETGGCGIRPFLDIWILNHRVAHDKQARDNLLRSGGLLAFAQAAEKVAEMWFSGVQPDALSKKVGDYILRAGLYGNNENRAALGQAKMGGKLRYVLFRRVFMPYDFLKAEYPILKNHKWLLPLYQVVRWCRMICSGGIKRTVRELKANAASSKEAFTSAADLLKDLGL